MGLWKHGNSRRRAKTPEYESWRAMRERCNQPRSIGYKSYGGRGIRVCQEWNDPANGFAAFFSYMGPKPSPKHTIDRIDNDGNYEPGNVRWATRVEQGRKTRHCRMNSELAKVIRHVAANRPPSRRGSHTRRPTWEQRSDLFLACLFNMSSSTINKVVQGATWSQNV